MSKSPKLPHLLSRISHLNRQIRRTALGCYHLRRDDVWLTSFPRSGNTWLRNIIGNLIGVANELSSEVDLCSVHERMPALGLSDLSQPWSFHTLPRFIKTHKNYTPVLFAAPQRVVQIIRDPRASLLSYYDLCCNSTVLQVTMPFSDFIRSSRYGAPAWIRHYESWSTRSTVVVRFEDLRKDTQAEVSKVLKSLDIVVSDEQIAKAVELSSIDRMRAREELLGTRDPGRHKEGFRTVGQGKTDGWREKYSPADLEYVDSLLSRRGVDIYLSNT